MAFEQITKCEAAERQFRMAVRLFFEEEDTIATYALAAAARDVLRDLSIAKGLQGSVFKDADFIRPEKRKDAIDAMNAPQNFLKHADRDPNGVLTFDAAAATVYVLVDCSEMHRRLTGTLLHAAFVFMSWYSLNNPDDLLPGPYADATKAILGQFDWLPEDKPAFLSWLEQGPLPSPHER